MEQSERHLIFYRAFQMQSDGHFLARALLSWALLPSCICAGIHALATLLDRAVAVADDSRIRQLAAQVPELTRAEDAEVEPRISEL